MKSVTLPAFDSYRRMIKNSQIYGDAIYRDGDRETPLRAQKQMLEQETESGLFAQTRAIVDWVDLPVAPAPGHTITFLDLDETYRIREYRHIGDGFVDIKLDA